jgi:hypothetical protein
MNQSTDWCDDDVINAKGLATRGSAWHWLKTKDRLLFVFFYQKKCGNNAFDIIKLQHSLNHFKWVSGVLFYINL